MFDAERKECLEPYVPVPTLVTKKDLSLQYSIFLAKWGEMFDVEKKKECLCTNLSYQPERFR